MQQKPPTLVGRGLLVLLVFGLAGLRSLDQTSTTGGCTFRSLNS
jgi:hypothetical protein